MPAIPKSVIAQTLGHVLALLIGYLAALQGFHASPQVSAEMGAAMSVLVGPLAGWLAREETLFTVPRPTPVAPPVASPVVQGTIPVATPVTQPASPVAPHDAVNPTW